MQGVKTDTINIKQAQISPNQIKNNKYTQKNNFFQKILKVRELSLFFLVIFLIILLSILTPNFWQISNFKSIARGFFLEAIPLIGMTFLLVSGVFDLSVGSVMALSGYVTAALVVKGVPLYISCLAGLLTGVFAGYVNGKIITFFGVNPLIMTFGMMSIARGIALAATQGQTVRVFDGAFINLGKGEIFGFPKSLIVLIIIMFFLDFCMRRVRYFRQLYFIGGNEISADLSGINVKKMRVIAYVIMGLLAAISGIYSNARLMGAIPTAFIGIELKLIVAAVIGGCSLNGGEGSIFGSMLGLIFLFLLSNGMTLLGISMYWENFVLGAFLILVVIVNTWSTKKNVIFL